MYQVRMDIHQVVLINKAIDKLRGLPHVVDPSDEVVDVLIKCMDWNMTPRQSHIPESELPVLHQKDVDLLDILQQNLPDKKRRKVQREIR
jgi:hypothetical protein